MKATIFSLFLSSASAFPFVAEQMGVDSSLYKRSKEMWRRQAPAPLPEVCPFNPNHEAAPEVTAEFPYNNARGGRRGDGRGGFQVPAPGDTVHEFREPNPQTDIRGPCPGLNAAANHGFLARDGITTFDELVNAQQNIYNVGYDLAVLLAVLGLQATNGDIVTERLSIGCEATDRTSFNPRLTGPQPGLNGHNKFEADSSLTRNDFFLANGDNFSFNGTLFGMMDETCNSNFDLAGLADYRFERYTQSREDNGNFFFGPLSLLLYGAASFLYELMPNGNRGYAPDLETISSFFGASQQDDGTWAFNNQERIPENWTNRLTPYGNSEVTSEILKMYLARPVLFGARLSDQSGEFVGINFGAIQNGQLPLSIEPDNLTCLLFQLALGPVPSSLGGLIRPVTGLLNNALSLLTPALRDFGCPVRLNS